MRADPFISELDPLYDPGLPCASTRAGRERVCNFLAGIFGSAGIGSLIGPAISGISGIIGSSNASSALTKSANQSAQLQEQIALFNGQNQSPYIGTGASGLSFLSGLEGLQFPGYNNPLTGFSIGPNQPGSPSDFYYQPTGLAPSLGPYSWALGGAPTNFMSPGSWALSPMGTSGYPQQLQDALTNFRGSPDYAFTRDQGMRALGQSQAAAGTYGSPAGSQEAIRYASGLASTDYNQYFNNLVSANSQQNNEFQNYIANQMNVHNATGTDYQNYFANASNLFNANRANYSDYFNRLSSLAGLGQTAASNLGTTSTAAGANIGNSILLGGQGQAAGYVGAANAVNSATSQAQLYSYLNGRGGNSAYGGSTGSTGGIGFPGSPGYGQSNNAYFAPGGIDEMQAGQDLAYGFS